MKKKFIIVLLLVFIAVPLFADVNVDKTPFMYPARVVFNLFTSIGISILLMIRVIWNIVREYNENHKISAVWAAVAKYLVVVAIVFFSLTILEFLFPNSQAVSDAATTFRG